MFKTFRCTYLLSSLILFGFLRSAEAQVSTRAATQVTQSVSDADRVTLRGNVHPAVTAAKDMGQVEDGRRFDHLQLQLKRSPAAQAALDQYIIDLHNPKSPDYHKWGTAAAFSQRFGIAQQDVDAVKMWLVSQGFTVHRLSPNLALEFSGTAGQLRQAFRTSLHNLNVNGVHHIANTTDPQIPVALAAAVAGPVALHDFKPKPLGHFKRQYTIDQNTQAVVPLDLHTIYNLGPLYSAGYSGQGQTIVLLGRTNLYSNGDWSTFRKTLGLARKYPLGNLKVVHPQSAVGAACLDPGVVTGDDSEAATDVEWASAAAPSATIELASCADSDFNFGAFTALENLLSGPTLPPSIVSLSYGAPESSIGEGENQYISQLYQLAIFEGVSLFVSTGDAGAAVTDQNQSAATHGINVSGLSSTIYNVAVGGTDFGDSFLGENSSYWNASNGASFNSAKSYVPEIPWSDSCASILISTALGFSAPYGADGACNSPIGEQFFLNTVAGSGGPSACATGEASVAGVVSGTCVGYKKPSYQSIFGNPHDGVRDQPDVSLFAGNGIWGHYYVLCYSNPLGGGVPCSVPPSDWVGGGGTSFASPIMAGIQSLVNQATGSAQGNPNFIYYSLAASQYGASGDSGCNSTQGSGSSPGCIFHDVTLGDMAVNCLPLSGAGATGTRFDCFYPKTDPGVNGVLSLSNTSYKPAYPAAAGWDFATGIGSVNAYNLVANWPGSKLTPKQKKIER